MSPEGFIRQGSGITYMSYKKKNISFIDSLHFFLEPLKGLSKTYDIDTIKGHFPHHFNIPENQDYVGTIPKESDLGTMNMTSEAYEKEFSQWYASQTFRTDWSFKVEMKKYCVADVDLLAKTVLKFRKLFLNSLDVDPFRYTTLASLCMSIYINKFIKSKTIVGNGTDKNISLGCKEWMNYLDDSGIIPDVPIFMKNRYVCSL